MTTNPSTPDVLSHFWAPLCAIGAHAEDGRPNAQIAVSVFGASIVADRPRLLVVLSHTNYTTELVAVSGTMAITLLSEAQLDLLEVLGLRSGRDGDKLADLEVRLSVSGDPIFPAGVGMIEARVIEAHDLGDSTAFLVAVEHREGLGGGSPMTWAAARTRVGDDFLERWAEKSRREQEVARAAMRWSEG